MRGIHLQRGEPLEGRIGDQRGIARVIRIRIERHGGEHGHAGQDHVIEQALLAGVMARGHLAHRVNPVRSRAEGGVVGAGVIVIPARERVREADDRVLVVGGDELALGIEHQRAIRVHAIEPDGEELLDLPRVVFVRNAARRLVGLVIAQHVEIAAHRRVQGHVFEQGACVAEGIGQQHVVVIADRVGAIGERAGGGDDQDFAERECDALAELVGCGDGVLPPRILGERVRVGVAVRVRLGAVLEDIRVMLRDRLGELVVDPSRKAQRLHRGDLRRIRAEGGLHEEACGSVAVERALRARRARRVAPRQRRGRGEGLRRGLEAEVAADFAGWVVGGVDVDVRRAVLDDLHDLRGGECAGTGDVPHVAAVLLRRSGVDVEDDLARIAIPRIGMDVLGGDRGGEVRVVVAEDRLRFIGTELERTRAVTAAHRRALSRHARRVKCALAARRHRRDVGRQRVAGHDLRGCRGVRGIGTAFAGLDPADAHMIRTDARLVQDLDVVAASRREDQQRRLAGVHTAPFPIRCGRGDCRAFEGVHRLVVVADVKLRVIRGSEPELIDAADRGRDVTPDARTEIVRVRRALRRLQRRDKCAAGRRGREGNRRDCGARHAGPEIAADSTASGDDLETQHRAAAAVSIRRRECDVPGARRRRCADDEAARGVDRPAGRQIRRAVARGRAAGEDLVVVGRAVLDEQHAHWAEDLRRRIGEEAGLRDQLLGAVRAGPAQDRARVAGALHLLEDERVARSGREFDRAAIGAAAAAPHVEHHLPVHHEPASRIHVCLEGIDLGKLGQHIGGVAAHEVIVRDGGRCGRVAGGRRAGGRSVRRPEIVHLRLNARDHRCAGGECGGVGVDRPHRAVPIPRQHAVAIGRHIIADEHRRHRGRAQIVCRCIGDGDDHRLGRFHRRICQGRHRDGRRIHADRQHHRAGERRVIAARRCAAADAVAHRHRIQTAAAGDGEDAGIERGRDRRLRRRGVARSDADEIRGLERRGDGGQIVVTRDAVGTRIVGIEAERQLLPVVHAVAIRVCVLHDHAVEALRRARGAQRHQHIRAGACEEARVRDVLPVARRKRRRALEPVALSEQRRESQVQPAAVERDAGEVDDRGGAERIGARRRLRAVAQAIAIRIARGAQCGHPIFHHPDVGEAIDREEIERSACGESEEDDAQQESEQRGVKTAGIHG